MSPLRVAILVMKCRRSARVTELLRVKVPSVIGTWPLGGTSLVTVARFWSVVSSFRVRNANSRRRGRPWGRHSRKLCLHRVSLLSWLWDLRRDKATPGRPRLGKKSLGSQSLHFSDFRKNGCSGERTLGDERYYGLRMDALVIACARA